MTAAIIHRSTPSLLGPPSQNTAPVLEFACLYTHDLRKKAKKWHDGFLRYHTFNKRVMLYDIPRNHIGGQHWTGEEDVREGDEVVLEKVGVKVEVAERTGETETDLSELRAKKEPARSVEPRERIERAEVGAVASYIARGLSGAVARGNIQSKHRSLHALLGTPRGTMGKAVLPNKSPFEERRANVENEEWESERPAKKARVAERETAKSARQDADRKANQEQQYSLQPSRHMSKTYSKTLRLAASAPKKRMLLCQDQLTKQNPQSTSLTDSGMDLEESRAVNQMINDRPMTARERVQQRVESIRRKKNAQAPSPAAAKKAVAIAADSDDVQAVVSSRNQVETNKPHQRTRSHMSTHSEEFGQPASHKISAMELGRLDRMMLPPAAPRRPPTPPIPIHSPREVRPLRRVISEPSNKLHPKRSREPTPAAPVEKEVRASFKGKAKKNLQKPVSLNVTSVGPSAVILGRPFQAPGNPQTTKAKKPDPPPEDVGPWSREAFDLFKWRPPGWDEEKWCVVKSTDD